MRLQRMLVQLQLALWTDPGGQVDLSFSLLNRYNMTVPAGYALGFQASRSTESEWMVSVKIM